MPNTGMPTTICFILLSSLSLGVVSGTTSGSSSISLTSTPALTIKDGWSTPNTPTTATLGTVTDEPRSSSEPMTTSTDARNLTPISDGSLLSTSVTSNNASSTMHLTHATEPAKEGLTENTDILPEHISTDPHLYMYVPALTDYPVEDGFLVGAAVLLPIDYYTDENEFTIKDGKLVRVLSDISVYGNTKYVLGSWRIIGPVLLTVLLITTILFCFLIIYRHKKGSEMNQCSTLLLVCIGVFDIITIACAMAENIYLYNMTVDNYGALPFDSCRTMYVLERLSPVPHTISLWLTLVLSLQRFTCVARPFSAKTAITLKKTILAIVLVILVAIGFHIPRYLDLDFRFAAVTRSEQPGQIMKTCDIFYKSWIKNSVLYEATYLWTRFVFVKLIPCVMMTVFAILMFISLRKTLPGRQEHSKSKANSSSNRLSLYIAIVSMIIVVAELPIGVISCIYAVSISTATTIIPFTTLKRISFIADVVLYVSYCVIFLLYCIMTKKVRSFISNCMFRVVNKTSDSNTNE